MKDNLALYEKVIPLAHLGIWKRNLVTGEIYWNQVTREIFEADPDFFPTLEQTFAFYVNPGSFKALFEKAIATGKPEHSEFLLRTAKGNLKWIEIRMRADTNVVQQAIIYGTIKDISGQRALLDTLAEQEQQFHHAFEYAPIGMALVSTTGAWIRVNKKLCDMLGYDKVQFLNKTFQDITHPDDLDLDLHQMYALLDGKTASYSMEKRYYHAEGWIIGVMLSVTLVRDKQGKPLYFVSQIKDITEQKRMEAERDQALEIIKAQNSRLLNFAYVVSHNLRSHAGNMRLLTELITQEEDPAERESLVSLLGVNSVNLLETLEHLNEVVDVRGGEQPQPKVLNLLGEIKKVKNVLSASLNQVGAKMVVRVAKDIQVTADQAYLESVLLNLLTNSIKYRETERGLQVNISARTEKNKLVLEINDNGVGIDLAAHGEKIFGMYNTFHGNKDARGIGLFLVKNHIEAMGGTIGVNSMPGEGTTFVIVLPHL